MACVTFARSVAALLLLPVSSLVAQRVFEKGQNVIYEDGRKNRVNLGLGFNPVFTEEGKVAMIRGRRIGYGHHFDCNHKDSKNWISVYDPATRTERVLFDRSLPFGVQGSPMCVFDQMQLSPNGSVLYLVSPVYATAGSLAIIQLEQGAATYVPGVNDVYVIQSGPHRGELIYTRRSVYKGDGEEHMYYPFIHAGADGRQIKVIAEEPSLSASGAPRPRLTAYLRKIEGQLMVGGKLIP
jgi:hypothetical protein